MNVFSQHLSSCFVDRLDFGVLCSSIPNSTCDVHEDQVVDKVGFEQPTCIVIFYEYVCGFEEEIAMKYEGRGREVEEKREGERKGCRQI